jgi:DNA-binding XRE family transcriptional regulator
MKERRFAFPGSYAFSTILIFPVLNSGTLGRPIRMSVRPGRSDDPKWIIRNDPFWINGNVRVLTIEQLRAARGLLGWSQSDLAKRAGLSLPTVKRVEAGTGPRVSEEARTKLQQTLESAGVVFIEENGGGAGVRLRKRQQKKG